ncbi:hypothetical protein LshimejAT787_2001070 [Lyophyllum shimeji]|uniref:Uncharacterized protein n=1 Tax=Lyophyllum shimeji TaxID=47721 RepID=A0A9P3PY54_LYOSH|nr:hypothetical protein LshimejAT787_2001070 [Lyophyllum shimeji]
MKRKTLSESFDEQESDTVGSPQSTKTFLDKPMQRRYSERLLKKCRTCAEDVSGEPSAVDKSIGQQSEDADSSYTSAQALLQECRSSTKVIPDLPAAVDEGVVQESENADSLDVSTQAPPEGSADSKETGERVPCTGQAAEHSQILMQPTHKLDFVQTKQEASPTANCLMKTNPKTTPKMMRALRPTEATVTMIATFLNRGWSSCSRKRKRKIVKMIVSRRIALRLSSKDLRSSAHCPYKLELKEDAEWYSWGSDKHRFEGVARFRAFCKLGDVDPNAGVQWNRYKRDFKPGRTGGTPAAGYGCPGIRTLSSKPVTIL